MLCLTLGKVLQLANEVVEKFELHSFLVQKFRHSLYARDVAVERYHDDIASHTQFQARH